MKIYLEGVVIGAGGFAAMHLMIKIGCLVSAAVGLGV